MTEEKHIPDEECEMGLCEGCNPEIEQEQKRKQALVRKALNSKQMTNSEKFIEEKIKKKGDNMTKDYYCCNKMEVADEEGIVDFFKGMGLISCDKSIEECDFNKEQ